MAKRRKKNIESSHLIESETFEDIEVTDPNTGETVTVKTKVIRYKSKVSSAGADEAENIDLINKLNNSVNYIPIVDIDA